MIEHHQIFINLSIGMVGSSGYAQAEMLLRDADTAMYHAKQKGCERYQFFEPKMHDRMLQQHLMERDLRLALERHEFVLYYQPILDLPWNHIVGVEALIRWQHPQKGLISPSEFIPIAEETGLIIPIGQWVFETACQHLHDWHLRWDSGCPLTMNINLSPRQLLQTDLLDFIRQTLNKYSMSGSQIKLEVTESALFEQVEVAQQLMQQLQDLQIRICLDDFGTGYSSLSHLHRFPVSTLKIDKSFIQGIDAVTGKLEIVRAIVAMAHSLKISVVGEGVESAAQLELLRIVGCEMAQGYHISYPLDCDKAGSWLAARVPDRNRVGNYNGISKR